MKSKDAGQIMTKKLITIHAQDPMKLAFDIMQANRFRHIPVTDDRGEIIGIVSDRDVQRAITCKKSNPLDGLKQEIDPSLLVIDFMSWPAKRVAGDTPIRDVALRMLNEKISALLVIDGYDQVKGLITTDDLLKYLISLLDKDPSRLRISVDKFIEDYASVSGWA